MMPFMNMLKPTSNLGLAYKAGKVIWGEKAVLSSMKQIKLLVLAHDAGQNIQSKITKKAFYYNIPVLEIFSTEDITHATGKKTPCLGITDEGFKKLLTV